jgi:hypothetical protein
MYLREYIIAEIIKKARFAIFDKIEFYGKSCDKRDLKNPFT